MVEHLDRKQTLHALILALVLLPALASAQTFGYDDSWSGKPLTAALSEVRAAIDAGKCGADAVAFINDRLHVGAVFVRQGGSGPAGVIQWYDKPLPSPWDKCGASKFQYLSPDGPYSQGWEVGLWSPSSYDVIPPKWRLNPYAPPSGDYLPPPAPPPIVTPPPPPPIVPVLAIDYDRIAAIVKADGDQTRAAVNEPGWFKKAITNPYVQGVLVAIGTCASTQCWKAKQ